MEVMTSKKDKDKVTYQGYRYQLDHRSQSRITWRCDVSSCKGWLGTPLDYRTNNVLPKECGEHSHPPNVTSVEVTRASGQMLRQAVSTNHPPRHIIMDNMEIVAVLDELLQSLVEARTSSGPSHASVVWRETITPRSTQHRC